MKNIIRTVFVFFLSCSAIGVFAQNAKSSSDAKKESIKWYTFEEAITLSKKNDKKKIFVDVYTDWCGWCKKMDASTFTQPVVVKYINSHYYPVKFNAERKDTIMFNGTKYVNTMLRGVKSPHQLASELLQGELSYPAYVFMDEKNKVITVVRGYIEAKEFEPIMNYFGSNSYKTISWEEYKKTFKGGI